MASSFADIFQGPQAWLLVIGAGAVGYGLIWSTKWLGTKCHDLSKTLSVYLDKKKKSNPLLNVRKGDLLSCLCGDWGLEGSDVSFSSLMKIGKTGLLYIMTYHDAVYLLGSSGTENGNRPVIRAEGLQTVVMGYDGADTLYIPKFSNRPFRRIKSKEEKDKERKIAEEAKKAKDKAVLSAVAVNE